MSKIIRILLVFWQLPQIIIGEIIYAWHAVFLRKRFQSSTYILCDQYKYVNAYIAYYSLKKQGICAFKGFSLGRRILIYYDNRYGKTDYLSNMIDKCKKHEYGHSVCSAYLGWLYIPLIAIPSLIITSISSNLAKKCYFEKWADNLMKNADIRTI